MKNKRRKCSYFNRASEKFNNMSKAMVFTWQNKFLTTGQPFPQIKKNKKLGLSKSIP